MINRIVNIIILNCLVLIFLSCEPSIKDYQSPYKNAEVFHKSMDKLTEVIVHDIFSPPVAARIYAYPSIVAYEIIRHTDSSYRSLEGQIHGFKNVPQPNPNEVYDFHLAAIYAFLQMGKELIFSEDKILQYWTDSLEVMRSGVPEQIWNSSIAYANEMLRHLKSYSSKDLYHETRGYPKYDVTEETGRWIPTPPDYMDGIEPHWNKIRAFVIDSSNQFIPKPPPVFSMDKKSVFYKDMMEVYNIGKSLDQEQRAIAEFWDCNPYVSHHYGHVMFATKKITPGGHWINITAIASRKNQDKPMQAIASYTLTSIALMDGFISCWDEKYRSNLIRPETVINKYLDENWRPLLQTPPFPEYTSGHSVISTAAATALTSIYGDNFEFIDTSEKKYGLKERSFSSFMAASKEAAISRLYGGIHYMPAIEEGIKEGEKIGDWVVKHIKLRDEALPL